MLLCFCFADRIVGFVVLVALLDAVVYVALDGLFVWLAVLCLVVIWYVDNVGLISFYDYIV